MRTEQLTYLIAVKEYGSLNKASQHLYMSSQNISKSLKNLEKELGVELIISSKNGTVLTKAGLEAAGIAQNFLDSFKNFQNKYQSQNEQISGNITVFSSRMPNIINSENILFKFSQLYPYIIISALEGDPLRIVDFIANTNPHYIGIGAYSAKIFTEEKDRENLNKCTIIPLVTDEVVVLADKKSALSKQKTLSPQILTEQKIAIMAHFNYQFSIFNKLLSPYINQDNVVFVTDRQDLYYKSIIQQKYIGLSCLSALNELEPYKNDISVIKIRPKITFKNSIILNSQIQLDCASQKFIDFMKDYYAVK